MNDASVQTTTPDLQPDYPADWFPDDIPQLMLLADNMHSHVYEIKANCMEQLLGREVRADNGRTGRLTDIISFEMDQEEYTPAIRDENALNAKLVYHVDGECEVDGVKSEVSRLPVWFDFQYTNYNTGYLISEMIIDY